MREGRAFVLLLSAALLPSVAALAKPSTKAAVKRDWTQAVVATPEGGFRMGNPAAKVKLIEYGSLACPHCRHFEETGYKPLAQNYVRTGQVSFEFRNYLLNGPDISVSMLTRCAGAAKFFPMSQQIFATQPKWQQKLQDLTDADKAALEKLSDQRRLVRFAEIAGVGEIAARFGVTSVRAQQCLADPVALKRLLDMTKAAMDGGISHTPTFLIDGKVVDAATWEDLEPRLKASLGGRG